MFSKKVNSVASICLRAKQVDVFDFLVDPRNTQLWVNTVEYVSPTPDEPIRVGTLVSCRVEFLGARNQAQYKIMELDSPNCFVGMGSSGKFNYSNRFDLIPSAKAGFTNVTWNVTIEYPTILSFGSSYVTNLISSELQRKLENLHRVFG